MDTEINNVAELLAEQKDTLSVYRVVVVWRDDLFLDENVDFLHGGSRDTGLGANNPAWLVVPNCHGYYPVGPYEIMSPVRHFNYPAEAHRLIHDVKTLTDEEGIVNVEQPVGRTGYAINFHVVKETVDLKLVD